MKNHSPRAKRVKVPTVFQLEATECGPASLAMILAYFGRTVSLDELRQECGVSARDGSNAAGIIKAAQKHGLEARGFHMGCEQVKRQDFPVMIHWKFNHFIVLEGYGPKGFYLRDSAVGAFTEDEDSFRRNFTGIVLTFKKTGRFMADAPQETSCRTWRRYLPQPGIYFTCLGLLAILLAVCEIAVWLLAAHFLEEVFPKNAPVRPVLAAILLVSLLQGVFTFGGGAILQLYQQRKGSALTKEVFRHLLSLPVSFFASRSRAGGRIEAVDAVVRTLCAEGHDLISHTVFVLAYAVLMFIFSPPLAGLVLTVFFANLLFTLITMNRRYDLLKKSAAEQSIYHGVVFALVSAVETIKSLGNENGAFNRYARHQAKTANDRQDIEKQSIYLAVAAQLAEYLCFALVLGLAGWAALNEKVTPGVFLIFYASLAGLFSRRRPFKESMVRMKLLKNLHQQVDDIVKCPPDEALAAAQACETGENMDKDRDRDKDAAVEKGGDKLKGGIRIESLCFGYDPDRPPLIEDFFLTLRPGARAAIVGVSGSGKSTLLKVIARLYQKWSGEVLFDGLPQVPRQKFIGSLALVEQDTSLFKGSIRENVTLWDPAVGENDIRKALEDACIRQEVAARGGLEAPVAQWGLNFSGGERQRLEIARALAQNPSIILLDEATSALDAITEKEILDNIKRRRCTVIIAAHRLSAVRDCDEIIVLDKGKIAEKGTHHDLKTENGIYRSLLALE